jgi:16S rRNA (guanine527-N7)-methyltransferase
MVFAFAALAPAPVPEGFVERAAELGIEFDDGDLRKLGLYVRALLEGNKSVNLTAVRDEQAAWEKHVLDSLTLLSVLAHLPEGARAIDVGSGGGLPGLPLAICMPHVHFTLLEATGKKIDFLRACVALLGIRNVEVLQARAEGLAHDRGERGSAAGKVTRNNARREAYDAVVARAVGRLCTLLELVVPFAKIGGVIALTKGAKAQDELDEAKEAMHYLKVIAGPLIPTPTSTIVIIEKASATPKIYPRADGEPARSPLGVKTVANREIKRVALGSAKPVVKEMVKEVAKDADKQPVKQFAKDAARASSGPQGKSQGRRFPSDAGPRSGPVNGPRSGPGSGPGNGPGSGSGSRTGRTPRR